MARADERYRKMKRRQEVEKLKELNRKFELCDQRTQKRLDAVVRKYEREGELKEQRERQLQKLKEEVRKEWSKAVSQQPWRLTKDEVEDLKRLRKKEGELHIKIQRLRDKEAMSETCSCTESEDERGQSHLKQQQMETRAYETPSVPHKCVCANSAVNSRLRSLLTPDEMKLMLKLQAQQSSLLLRIKAIEDKRAEASKVRL